jgi:hypothetical protein
MGVGGLMKIDMINAGIAGPPTIDGLEVVD